MTGKPRGIRIGECLRYGWDTFKAQLAGWLLVTVVVMVGSLLVQWLLSLTKSALASAVSVLVGGLFAGAFASAARASARGREPTLDDALVPFKARQGDYLIVGLASSSGVLLCGVGLLVTAFLFLFAPILLVEGRDFKQALIESKDLAVNNAGDVVLLMLVLGAFTFAGVLACGVGLFVSLPIAMLALSRAYDQLTEPAGVLAPPEAPEEPPAPSPL